MNRQQLNNKETNFLYNPLSLRLRGNNPTKIYYDGQSRLVRHQQPINDTMAAITELDAKTKYFGMLADVSDSKDISRVFDMLDKQNIP